MIDPTGHTATSGFQIGFQQGAGLFSAFINAAALLTGDKDLGIFASAFSLFIAIDNKIKQVKEQKAKDEAAKNNKPTEDPVEEAENSGAGETAKDNAIGADNQNDDVELEQLNANLEHYTEILGQLVEQLESAKTDAEKIKINQAINACAETIVKIKNTISSKVPDFDWPTIGVITSVKGERPPVPDADSELVSRKPHTGIDIANSSAPFIKASAGGKIIEVGKDQYSGNFIIIEHSGGYTTKYGHLADKSINVSKGDFVKQGQIIAQMGSTGLSSGTHLHFEIRKNGQYLDPLSLLPSPGKGISFSSKLIYDPITKTYKNQ